uniref:Dynactin subunit 4 n=1 Tax=Cacopsylla melanoneura TaxID=428564 RepID=A0A8D8SBJ7_9HEMI
MAFLAQQEAVIIACTCGSLKPVCRTYFCRHCFVIRCGNCVSNEVDSIYCAFCLDNVTCEVRLKKTACHLCLECPICQHSLSVRSHTVRETTPQLQPPPASKHATPSNRAYYLACFFCRWTSRDSNIPDQKTASGSWPERTNSHTTRLNVLLDYYKSIGALEKSNINIDHQSYMKYLRKPTHLLEDQFGFSANVRKQKVELLKKKNLILTDPHNKITVEGSVPTDEIEPLSEDFITKEIDLLSIPKLKQRFNIPDLQPDHVSQLMPYHKRLMVKQSQRCRECEHNVCKPEYNPSSIKFKIQLSGYFCIPEIRIISYTPLRAGHPSEITFKICNQFKESTTIKFKQLPAKNSEEDLSYYKTLKKEILLTDNLHKSTILMEEARIQAVTTTGHLDLPECEIVLPPRDDAADCDDLADNQNYNDEPKVVIWRKCNKVGVRMEITPSPDLTIGSMVKVGFLLNFTYTNTLSSTLENKQAPQIIPVDVNMFIDVGVLSDETQT